MVAIDALQLHIDATSVKWSIIDHPKLKLKAEHVRVHALDQVSKHAWSEKDWCLDGKW